MKVLRGQGAEDETVVALTIAAYMCVLGGAFEDFNKAYEELKEIIESGKAIEKFKELIRIQGGDESIVDNPDLLPDAKNHIEIRAEKSGYIGDIDAEDIGMAAMLLGAGRQTKDDKIDFAAGISLKKKMGDPVKKDEVLAILHTNLDDHGSAEEKALGAFKLVDEKIQPVEYIYDIIK